MIEIRKALGISALVLSLASCDKINNAVSNIPIYADEAPKNASSSPPFPENKILTVSARDYCSSIGKRLSDYEMVGINGNGYVTVPSGTEVVVNFIPQFPQKGYAFWYIGTALIPKKKK